MRQILVLLTFLWLTGCTTMADRLQGSIQPPPGYGYAIFSLTGRAFEPDTATASLNWQSLDTLQNGTVWASMNTDTIFGAPDTGMSEGKLELLTLPPGRYMLTTAYGNWMEEGAWSRYRKMQTYPLNLPFNVIENKAVYLGEIQLDMSYRPSVNLLDSHVRDFNHMKRIWKVQDMSPVITQLLKNPDNR